MKIKITYKIEDKEFTKEVEGEIINGELKIPFKNEEGEDLLITKIEL